MGRIPLVSRRMIDHFFKNLLIILYAVKNIYVTNTTSYTFKEKNREET